MASTSISQSCKKRAAYVHANVALSSALNYSAGTVDINFFINFNFYLIYLENFKIKFFYKRIK